MTTPVGEDPEAQIAVPSPQDPVDEATSPTIAPPMRPTSGRGGVGGFLARSSSVFLLIGGVFLGIFVAMVPPGWGLDEQGHFYRMYQISEGRLFPQFDQAEQIYAAPIPRTVYDLLQQGWFDSNTVDRAKHYFNRTDLINKADYDRLKGAALDPDDRVTTDVTQTMPNVPIVYFAPAAGLAVVRAFGGDVGAMVLGAKIGNALQYLALAFAAVWFARRLRLRWLVMTVALVPAAIYQASVISADTFTNGVCLLLVSMVFTLILQRTPASRAVLIALAAAAAGVALSKPTYSLLIALIAVLPSVVFASRKQGRWYKAAVLTGSLVLTAVTVFLGQRGSVAVLSQRTDFASQINPVEQLMFVVTHPLQDIAVLGRTLEIYGASWVQGLVGLFGYNTVPVPWPFPVLAVLLMAAAGFYTERLRRAPALAALAAGLLVCLALVFTFYLTFNPVRSPAADGVQGRYFLPCVVAITLGSAGLLPIRMAMTGRTARVFFPAASSVILFAAALAYYLTVY